MCEGPLFTNIIRYAFPFILTGFFQQLYNAADVIVVGRYAGQEALAGVGTCGSLITFVLNLFLGLSMGVSVVMGNALGSKDSDRIKKTLHTSVLLSIIGGIFVAVFGFIFAEFLLKLISVPDDVMPQAKIYMQIIFLGKCPALIYTFGIAILRAKGDTKRPLYISLIAGLINVGLNLIFVLKFKMAADGVATATSISQLFSAVVVIYLLCRETDNTKLELKKLHIHKRSLIDIVRIGVPSGLQSMVFSLSNILVQSSVNTFGTAAIAGSSASNNIGGFYYAILHSMSQTTTAFVSQNMGAKKFDRISKTVKYSLIDMTFISVVFVLLTVFASEFLIGIYTPGNPEALRMGVIRLGLVGTFYGLCGFMEIMNGAIRGMRHATSTMFVSILGVCGIRIMWIFTVFKAIGTFESLFWCFPVSWGGTFLMQSVLYLFVRRHAEKKLHTV